ncbi:MAG: HlyD family secretion protein, partial [Bacteroidia bacterium]
KADAYGNFEAIEITVSSETTGKILSLNIEEGKALKAGEIVGFIDSTQTFLKIEQLKAQRSAIVSKTKNVVAQKDVYETQKRNTLIEKKRIENMLKDQAATQKQLDDINAQIKVLDKQIQSVGTQNSSVSSEVKAIDMQIAQLKDQLTKSRIINPVNGTVLSTFAEAGEIAVMGKALYKIADLNHLFLRVYMDATQLANLKIGQKVDIFIDKDKEENTKVEGTVSWISPNAEFTPKIIQTKDERVNLVYAVKVLVENTGNLKIGMPGEVKLGTK